jgi:hypothetical protein
MPVARPLDPPAPTVPQLLHRTVVARLTAERDAAREELEAVEAQMEPLARSMIYKGNSVDHWWAKAHAYKGIVHAVCEAFRALGYGGEMGDLETLPKRLGTFAESLLGQRRDLEVALDQRKREVDAARLEAGALRERIEAAYRAMEAANEMVPRGPAGDTLAAKITALVAILRTAHTDLDLAYTAGVAAGRAAGRAAAIVEAVDLLNDQLKRMADITARSTTLWAIELIKGIKP